MYLVHIHDKKSVSEFIDAMMTVSNVVSTEGDVGLSSFASSI